MLLSFSSMNWGEKASWLALVISVVGTISSPLITTFLTNRHQRKMYQLKIKNRMLFSMNEARVAALTTFLADVGRYLSLSSSENLSSLGSSFFSAYAYIPAEHWDAFDALYSFILNMDFNEARKSFIEINHIVNCLLKEPLPVRP